MKRLYLIFFIIIFSSCSFLSNYRLDKAEKSFKERGVNIESLEELDKVLENYPENRRGIELFKEQYETLQKNIPFFKLNKDILSLSELEMYENYIYLNEIYERFSKDTKDKLSFIKRQRDQHINREIFYNAIIKSFNSKMIDNYDRFELKRWFKLLGRNNQNSEIKTLENRVQQSLNLNIAILNENYYFLSGIDNPLDNAIRRKRGYRTGFYNFIGYGQNQNVDIIVKLRLENIEDYSEGEEIQKIGSREILRARRGVRIRGEYLVYLVKNQQLLTRDKINKYERYTIEMEVLQNKFYPSERVLRRERDSVLERTFNELLNDIILKIKVVY